MHNTKTSTKSSLFITLSFEDRLSKVANDLPFYARQAYVNRDYDLLQILSDSMVNLSSKTEDVGRLYQAHVLSLTAASLAEERFVELIDSQNGNVRAAATITLGGIEFRRNNVNEAQKLITIAGSTALMQNNPAYIIALVSQSAYSRVLAETGDSAGSLRVLQDNERLAEWIGYFYPGLLGEYWNNLACGYLELGNLEAALYYINRALSMKVAMAYPEWFETKQEIDEKIYEKNYRKLVSIESYDRVKPAVNVSQITSKQTFYVCFDYYDTRYKALKFITDDSEESEIRFTSLILTLQSICTDVYTGIKVSGFFSPIDGRDYQFVGDLESEKIYDFFNIIDNIKNFESQNPLKEYSNESTTPLDVDSYKKIIEWVRSFIDEGLEIPTFENNTK